VSKSGKHKGRATASTSSSGGKPEKFSAPESGEDSRRSLVDRPLSMKKFAERAAALQRELSSSVDSTKIIRAHRDGCCCELDECCPGKRKERPDALNVSREDNPKNEAASMPKDGWRWPLADRPLSKKEFAERAAALQRELRSSVDSTKIIRAHRDGCCFELDECCEKHHRGAQE